MIYNLLASVIRALGDSKTPFYFLVLASILNILLDLLFVIVFGMGVGGAALATAVAQTISIIVCVVYMKRCFPILKGEMSEYNIFDLWILLGFGIPFGLQFSITAIGSMMLQAANNALGTACATAFTAAMRLKMFFICAFENLGVAMATYCGQNLGAKKMDRVISGIKDALLMMVVYWLFTMAILLPYARDLSMLFIYKSATQILDYSEQFMRISCLNYLFLGSLVIFRYSLQGLGYTRLAMWSGVSELIARALVSLFVVPLLGFLGVCIGDPAAWVAANIFLLPAFWHVYNKLKNTVTKAAHSSVNG
jgi:Na+-driven multidrug efflux pump